MRDTKVWSMRLAQRLYRALQEALTGKGTAERPLTKRLKSPFTLAAVTCLALWAINSPLKSFAWSDIAQATTGPESYMVRSTPDHVIWGELFKPDS
ncbi:MAG: hypothetical protein WA901_16965, partial [Phormidesmis sp.]